MAFQAALSCYACVHSFLLFLVLILFFKTVHLAHNEADGTSGMAVAQALMKKPHISCVNLNGKV